MSWDWLDWLVPVVMAAIVALAIYQLVGAVLRGSALTRRGIDRIAKVIEKKRSGSTRGGAAGSPTLLYEYRGDREWHKHRSHVTEEIYEQYQVGDEFPIVFDPQRPSRSMPKYLIEQSRAALAKREQAKGRKR